MQCLQRFIYICCCVVFVVVLFLLFFIIIIYNKRMISEQTIYSLCVVGGGGGGWWMGVCVCVRAWVCVLQQVTLLCNSGIVYTLSKDVGWFIRQVNASVKLESFRQNENRITFIYYIALQFF